MTPAAARPLRVLYVSETLEPARGATSKVFAIAQEWEKNGHTVWLTTTRDTRVWSVAELAARRDVPPPTRGLPQRVRGELAFRISYPLELALHARRLRADVIYCRELPPAPGLHAVMRRWPFVLEMNGNVAREIAVVWDRVTRSWSRRRQLADAAGVVFVSRALRDECDPQPARVTVIGNPCLPPTPVQGPPAERPLRPRLVLAGYAHHPWSGMDKLVKLAQALPDLDFLAIGAELSGPPNLRSVPPVPQAEADRLIRGCTVGIGPLAPHRQGTSEASPLKSRNYFSLGLPVIQAYEDTDLREAFPCILQLPNCEDNVLPERERIREFAFRAFQDPSLGQAALQLASGPLSLAHKERTRLAFVERCVREQA